MNDYYDGTKIIANENQIRNSALEAKFRSSHSNLVFNNGENPMQTNNNFSTCMISSHRETDPKIGLISTRSFNRNTVILTCDNIHIEQGNNASTQINENYQPIIINQVSQPYMYQTQDNLNTISFRPPSNEIISSDVQNSNNINVSFRMNMKTLSNPHSSPRNTTHSIA